MHEVGNILIGWTKGLWIDDMASSDMSFPTKDLLSLSLSSTTLSSHHACRIDKLASVLSPFT